MKRAGGILIVLVMATLLEGCLFRLGPCAGYGCPAFAPKPTAQTQQPRAQAAQNRNAETRKTQTASIATPEQTSKAGQ